MIYREIKVNGFLTNFIQCFWEYENIDAEIEHTILPDGYFDLIAEFENGILSKVKLTGVWTKPIKVTIPRLTKIFAIRFKVIAAEYLLKQEIKTLLDCSKILPLSVWGIDALSSDDFDNFASTISNQVNVSLKHLKKIDNRKIKLFQLIYQDNNLSIKALSRQVFWSS